jgi:tRNA-2-methylthio-N6-dimethylallyladenosine synthase
MKASPKSVFFRTFGCQMNVYDSERMRGSLAAEGYAEAERPEDADVVVLNTCHIREHAAEKVYSEVGRLKALQRQRREAGKDLVVTVAGCVAQAEGPEILRRAKAVDIVVGPQAYHRLPELIARRQTSDERIVETEFPVEDKFDALAKRSPRRAGGAVAAFLTVQEGCDKFCTFCVVPYTRGVEFSRPVRQVLSEAESLAEQGVREITLLGQNVNAYHGDDGAGGSASLAMLVAQLSQIDGIERIRYTTSHPRDMTDDLIEAHATNAKLMPYLHLPVQSGSDAVLKAMNRGHTVDDYMRLIGRIRAARPDIALSGDFIVGFPGETEEDFEATLALVRAVGYGSAYAFRYSARPGTPAAEKLQQVPIDVASDRLQRLLALIVEQQAAFNRSMIGKVLPVLLEKRGLKPGQITGRSPYLQPVHVDGDAAAIGLVRQVKITGVKTNSLSGQYHLG